MFRNEYQTQKRSIENVRLKSFIQVKTGESLAKENPVLISIPWQNVNRFVAVAIRSTTKCTLPVKRFFAMINALFTSAL